MKSNRRLVTVGLGVFLLGAFGWNGNVLAQALEKQKVSIAVGGKNLLYYLPLTIAEQQGLFQGRGPGGRDQRLRRRRQGTAGAGRRQRRRGIGRLRTHHQHAGQGPGDHRLRAAGARAADRVRRVDQDHAELQIDRRPEGQEDRRHRARLVDQHDGQLRAGQGRPEADRCLVHRRRHLGRRLGALRSGQIDAISQPRSR